MKLAEGQVYRIDGYYWMIVGFDGPSVLVKDATAAKKTLTHKRGARLMSRKDFAGAREVIA